MIIKKKKKSKKLIKILFISTIFFIIGNITSSDTKKVYDSITGFLIKNEITFVKDNIITHYDFNQELINHTEGIQGNALKLNGTNYLIINKFNQTEFTICMWIKPNITENSFLLSAKDNEAYIVLNKDETISWEGHGSLVNRFEKFHNKEWNFLCFVRTNNHKKFYLNGELRMDNQQKTSQMNDKLYIGRYRGYTTNMFKGLIDEILILNRTLKTYEIKRLYEAYNPKIKYLITINENQGKNNKIIRLDINEKNYQKIIDKREEALRNGILISSDKDYVKANLTYNNKTIKVKIRLKGDLLDHLKTEKWSFRVETKNDEKVMGMKTFSLQGPERRGKNEALFYALLKKEGLISLRYIPIQLIINNKSKGNYIIEEHFSKELIENNKRIEGPIIKINEDLMWLGYSNYITLSNIDCFNTKSTLNNELKNAEFEKARNLMNAFRQGKIKADDVFDVKQIIKLAAIIDLTGGHHAYSLHNMRFYYNPITEKLEPIAYDASTSSYPIKKLTYNNNLFKNDPLKENIKNIKLYIQELTKVSNEEYLKEIVNKYSNLIQDYDILVENQKFIRSKLNPKKAIQTYAQKYENNSLILRIKNIQEFPIQVLSLYYNDVKISEYQNKTRILWKQKDFEEYKFIMPDNFKFNYANLKKLKISYRIIGSNNKLNDSIYPYSTYNNNISNLIKKPNYKEFNFLSINENKSTILIKSGNHKLNKTLILPSNYTVYCFGNTTIDLINHSKIVSYAKQLIFKGTKENPIYIISSDQTGEGLNIINNYKQSLIENTIFYNLTNNKNKGTKISGSITIYESPINIINSKFINLKSDDGVNIVRSKVYIKDSTFLNIDGDCFDGDFIEGIIKDSKIKNCKGDGIDLSGSIAELNNNNITKVNDKGISIGEATITTISNNNIQKSFIGIASKDKSITIIKYSTINQTVYDLAVYQKKSEYGPSSISVYNSNINTYIVEEKSRLEIDNKLITNKTVNVFNKLYSSDKK